VSGDDKGDKPTVQVVIDNTVLRHPTPARGRPSPVRADGAMTGQWLTARPCLSGGDGQAPALGEACRGLDLRLDLLLGGCP
jgi:hypothetical protein